MTEILRGNRITLLAAVLILTLGLVLSGYLLGDGLRRSKMAERSVTVRGLAERDVVANLATWSLGFAAEGEDPGAVQAKIEADTRKVQAFFRAAGFPASALNDAGGSINSRYDSDRNATITTISRTLQFRTTDVMRARRAYARQFDLIRGGVGLSGDGGVVYSFTRLNAIKPELIGQSIGDARRGADRFARDSGTAVGGIKSATQGYFSIAARDGDVDGEGGSSAGASPLQKVRVVTTIEFYLD